ncbi:MAG: FUSC family protein, partial [Betaproteobacteria bacterium]|nr:FUSC family protein [Betaproteobacteria bacterium]
AASSAILITCFAWIGLGWAEGGTSAVIASILCCLFAAMDDPVPAIKVFGVSICMAVLLAGTYVFLIFPAIDSFPMLVLSLAPTMLTIGVITLNPRLAMPSLITLLNFCNYLAIQERFNPDFAGFLNTNLSQFFGLFTAIYVIRTVRSMSADASARRLLKHAWKSLAHLAQGKSSEESEAFTSRMVDRLGMLVPRLAATQDKELTGLDALTELRIGMDLVILQETQPMLTPEAREVLERLSHAIGEYYSARCAGISPPSHRLQPLLDTALSTLSIHLPAGNVRPLAALIGLRRNLCPHAQARPLSDFDAECPA